MRITALVALTVLVALSRPAPSQDAQDYRAAWDRSVTKAIAYLRQAQAEDGSWSARRNVGITGLVVTGLLATGKVTPDDPMIRRALGYIEKLVSSRDGHIAGSAGQLRNYITAVNAMALAAANQGGKYDEVLKAAAHFMIGLQWDEQDGAAPSDPRYGGFGYDGKSRPDLSNTSFALEALRASGVKADDPALKRAAIYLSRCQDLKGEHQDQNWPEMRNDGSFGYVVPGARPESRSGGPVTAGGYASMTYAGIKSMIYAGVDKNDRRVQEALNWIRKNYSVEKNAGQPKGREHSGLFYSYHTMSKALTVIGWDTVEDAQGVKHHWRQELTLQLAKVQQPDGSWVNAEDRFMEGDPNLVTGFALMALGYTKPK